MSINCRESWPIVPRKPLQYGEGWRCASSQCKAPGGAKLSRYNPHTICGPCRMRISNEPDVYGDAGFRRRRPVEPAELPEPEQPDDSPVDPVPAEDAPIVRM